MPRPAPLADGEMDDAVMPAEHAAVEVDDLAGLHRSGPQPLDDVGIAPGRHEADVLAVLLVGDRAARSAAPVRASRALVMSPSGKRRQIELLARGGKQEIALVALGIARAVKQRARPSGSAREAT